MSELIVKFTLSFLLAIFLSVYLSFYFFFLIDQFTFLFCFLSCYSFLDIPFSSFMFSFSFILFSVVSYVSFYIDLTRSITSGKYCIFRHPSYFSSCALISISSFNPIFFASLLNVAVFTFFVNMSTSLFSDLTNITLTIPSSIYSRTK